jgi:signal transduction histidine kinase/CheY-like chemotaxis protein
MHEDALEERVGFLSDSLGADSDAAAVLQGLADALARVAEGDLSARLQIEVPLEHRLLKDRFNGALARLVEARRDADAAERAKADFLGKVSREIRTPLNGVIGVAGALLATELTTAQHEMVDLIKGSAETVERLFADIVDVEAAGAAAIRLESGALDLRTVVEGAVAPFRAAAAAKSIGLGVRFVGCEDVQLVGDAARLGQVVASLVSNAVKFTDEGGVKIQALCAEASDEPGTVDLTIEVSDTGIGFEPSLAGHIFDRFAQADASITRRFGGAGLGLAICKSIVAAMSGEISAASTPGRGSQFVVSLRLPRCAVLTDGAPAGAVHPPPGAAEASPTPSPGRPQVLLAEDHPVNRRVVRLILDPIGVDVVEACDGADAVRRYAEQPFDVVLMDIHMPVMDGLTATKAIRQIEASQGRKPARVVMLTADAGESHRRAAKAIGADDHMPKPVQRERLIASVLSVLKDVYA